MLQNTDGIVGNLILANTNTSIGTLNKTVCQDIGNSPTCENKATNETVLEIKGNIVKDNNIFSMTSWVLEDILKNFTQTGFLKILSIA